MDLSIVIPFYDDPLEALGVLRAVHDSLTQSVKIETVLVDLDVQRHDPLDTVLLPEGCTLLRYESFPGLAAAKNRALAIVSSEFVLFLYPGLFPRKGAIEEMIRQFSKYPELGVVAGRWLNTRGQVEKGYNLRRFPTFAALMFDLLLINKFFPQNSVTRDYKMRDFDHSSPMWAEHANDCVFMSRVGLLRHLGGFPEDYFPGWYDQVVLCQRMRKKQHAILYDPTAEFISNTRLPLFNRLLRDYYSEHYASEYRYVKLHFQAWQAALYRAMLPAAMMERLLFSGCLPRPVRRYLTSRFRSYLSEDEIQRMRRAYASVLRASLTGLGKTSSVTLRGSGSTPSR